jgi:hypothetical protein
MVEMEQEQVQVKKKSNKTWWIVGGVGCALLLLIACVVVIIAVVVSGSLMSGTKKADTAAAQVVLRNAVSDAEQFAADNDGSYDGMGAGDLTNIDSSITWVDGDPGSGQVGIIDAGQDTFALTYKDDTGTSYQAVRKSDGTVKYTDANGKAL